MSTPPLQTTPEHILQRLDWQIVRRLDGILQGDYRSLFYGFGVDFADLREYQPEDDVRYIDWNVTARMDHPYVRQYSEDREIHAWFLLDLSPSLDFGYENRQKRDMLINFVTVLGRLLTRHGNKVGAMFFSSRIDRTIPARGGRTQVLRILNDLLNYPHRPEAPFTNLSDLIQGGLNAIKRRSLIFVVSDFISEPGWERPLMALNRHNEVVAIRITDPREMELPDVGWIVLEDAETGEQVLVDTHDAHFRSDFSLSARQRVLAIDQAFHSLGVDTLTLSTDDDLVKAVIRFAETRRRQGNRAKQRGEKR